VNRALKLNSGSLYLSITLWSTFDAYLVAKRGKERYGFR